MKRLVAKKPIQHMGRTYGAGEAIPAYDGKMVEAWLNAGTAAWDDPEREQEEHQAAMVAANIRNANNALAVGVLNTMGVQITDENGVFVGVVQLAEQIVAVVQEHATEGQKPTESDADGQDGQEHTEEENGGQAGRQGAQEGEMLTGHLDAADLATWKKPELEKLAEDLGVDISAAKNNTERAALLAAVTVQAPKAENGGAQ